MQDLLFSSGRPVAWLPPPDCCCDLEGLRRRHPRGEYSPEATGTRYWLRWPCPHPSPKFRAFRIRGSSSACSLSDPSFLRQVNRPTSTSEPPQLGRPSWRDRESTSV